MPLSAAGSVYLNAAGHGLPDKAVGARMEAYLQREREAGPARAAAEAGEELAAVRAKAAALLGVAAQEAAFCATTSLAWATAVAALPLKGRRILAAPNEWGANIAALQRLEDARDMRLETLPVKADGALDLARLEAMLDDDVAAICAPMVSSLTGRRYPVEAIGALARPAHSFYIVDAAQALGQMPVSPAAIGCDLLAATARKWLRGPRGVALLHVPRETLARLKPVPVPDIANLEWRAEEGRYADTGTAARFEMFDFLVPQRLALGAAIDAAAAAPLEAVRETVLSLAQRVRRGARETGLEVLGPDDPQSGIVTLRLPAARAEAVRAQLAQRDILVKFPQRTDEPLLAADGEDVLLRISAHVYNSGDEIDALFGTIAERL